MIVAETVWNLLFQAVSDFMCISQFWFRTDIRKRLEKRTIRKRTKNKFKPVFACKIIVFLCYTNLAFIKSVKLTSTRSLIDKITPSDGVVSSESRRVDH